MNRPRSTRVAFTALLVVAVSHAVAAHDFWLEPSSFSPPVGSALRVHFRVGDHFSGELLPRNEKRLQRFVAIAPDGAERPIVGRHGVDPAGILRVDAPGLWTLAYRGSPSAVTLAPEAFEAYLEEEGLQRVSRERARLGETRTQGREHFSRAVKSLVVAGSADLSSVTGFDRAAGLTLEIIPEANPFEPGRAQLPVRLLFEGQPLQGALIVALRKSSSGSTSEMSSSVRTDASGRAVVGIGPGLWMIKAVHMVRVSDTPGIDWESTWTSVTFEVGSKS